MKNALLIALLASISCGGGGTYLQVTVTNSGLELSLSLLEVTVIDQNDKPSKPVYVRGAGPSFTVPPDQTFVLSFDRSQGPATVTVDVAARDSSGLPAAHARTALPVRLVPGGTVRVTLDLGAGEEQPDLAVGESDLGPPPACTNGQVDKTSCGACGEKSRTCNGGQWGAFSACSLEGMACGAGDGCHDAPTCVNGACTPHQKADGTPCGGGNACNDPPLCSGGVCGSLRAKPNGFNWDGGNYLARCCGGQAIQVNTDANCGGCGISCGGRGCVSAFGGHYYCNCSANSECWSNCCSTYYGAPYVCAASDCLGGCTGTTCPSGSTCVEFFPNGPNYCQY